MSSEPSDEEIAEHLIRVFGLSRQHPHCSMQAGAYQLGVRWDGAAKGNDGIIFLEVEPLDVPESHVRLHVINYVLLRSQKKGICELRWIVLSEGESCHMRVVSPSKPWLEAICEMI